MIVRFFYYYHLNLIYDSLIDLIRGNMILLIKNFHLEMTLTSNINKYRDLDLQAIGGGWDSTEKIFGPIPISRPYMNPIYPRVWK